MNKNRTPEECDSAEEESTTTSQTPQLEDYNFDKTTIIIHIQLLPALDGIEQRQVSIGVGIKNEAPILQFTQLSDLELPIVIASMLEQLKAEMPQRKAAALVKAEALRQEQQRLEEQRKQTLQLKSPPGNTSPNRSIPAPTLDGQSDRSEETQQLTLF